jgi:hypothetical protein
MSNRRSIASAETPCRSTNTRRSALAVRSNLRAGAFEAYISIAGQKQGKGKGESVTK